MEKKLTIAIDGYSACGKSTLAKDLAKQLGYLFIDSGAMYRGITLYALQNGMIDSKDIQTSELIEALPFIQLEFRTVHSDERAHLFLNGNDVEHAIRTPEVAANVSQVATIKAVREKLVQQQQHMGQTGGVIMDGRDIGSVVFPNAELKLFVTAQPEIRAKRRLLELQSKGIESTLEAVLANLLERDHIDSTRSESPLTQTPDAVVLDTSFLSPDEQVQYALTLVRERLKEKNI